MTFRPRRGHVRIRLAGAVHSRVHLSRTRAAMGGAILVLVLAACGAPDRSASPTTPVPANITLLTATATFGTYLTDSSGRALYMWDADREGSPTCYGTCAAEWPPLTVGDAAQAGPGVDASLIATVARKGGTEQVTYGGWPLYYYEPDTKAGDLEGQGNTGFGAVWWVVDAKGEPLPSS